MKRIFALGLTFMLVTSITITAFAGGDGNSIVNNHMGNRATSQIQPRGEVISTAILDITNPENGEIGVYIQTLTHTNVDKTIFKIYLDQWIESESRWSNIDKYSFEFTKEDVPDGDLTLQDVSFNITGKPVNRYYRLRGIHIVESGSIRETLTTQTDGLLITK